MRIHRVEIEGFGPFRERQVIDLDAYAVDGLFLIGGRTGAGKSSILDAITFAIFGSVPRYEGGEKRLRSDHCEPDDPTSVAVEFTTGGTRWRIERSPEYERPKKRGDGMTIAAARAQMGEVTSGAVEWKAAKDRDVANLVAEVVGLNQQQFLQVILLAQGRFARFLLADNNDRQKLLRTLFGSRRFEDYENELDQRAALPRRRCRKGGSSSPSCSIRPMPSPPACRRAKRPTAARWGRRMARGRLPRKLASRGSREPSTAPGMRWRSRKPPRWRLGASGSPQLPSTSGCAASGRSSVSATSCGRSSRSSTPVPRLSRSTVASSRRLGAQRVCAALLTPRRGRSHR